MGYLARFFMSEAQAEQFPDWESRETVIALGTLGAQLTYEHFRACDTGETIATWDNGRGYWIAKDGQPYTDVVIVMSTDDEEE